MRCNACWRELEGRAVSTKCGHLLSNLGTFILSLMKPVDINPNDEWINMAMAGISPQICILQNIDLFFSSQLYDLFVLKPDCIRRCRATKIRGIH
ncbi:hypothetical protein Goarm_017551 [Gossypium armourianum]|uniref:Uncharacterized protein n=1 Tax=Gossypium armourianum TaxID=34283 RepID=A0A7J9JHA4_9ROSI|nr:hypothetical protein [Gossypium armourianum]